MHSRARTHTHTKYITKIQYKYRLLKIKRGLQSCSINLPKGH